jgi:hypothetical protein
MPVGTFEYRDEAEKAAIEQAIAFVAQMRDLAVAAPHGQVIARLEGHAVDAGRDLLRTTPAWTRSSACGSACRASAGRRS